MPFRAGSAVTAGDAAATSLVITRPAGAAVDDILALLLYVEDQSLTPSLSPGSWTKITTASGEVSGAVPFETHIYWSRQGVESGDITITWGGANVWNTAVAGAYTGRYPTGDPQDGTATFTEDETGSDSSVTCTGLTTGNANADIVACASNWGGFGATWSVVTERADFGGESFADVVQAGAGASGDKTATLSSAAGWAAGLLALREAAAVSVAVTGTAIAGGVTEAQLTAPGETAILTLTGDTYIPN